MHCTVQPVVAYCFVILLTVQLFPEAVRLFLAAVPVPPAVCRWCSAAVPVAPGAAAWPSPAGAAGLCSYCRFPSAAGTKDEKRGLKFGPQATELYYMDGICVILTTEFHDLYLNVYVCK